MKRSLLETVLGAFVVIVAVAFLYYSYNAANVGNMNGYTVTADFTTIGGLQVGDDVQISGVKVGQVGAIELRQDSYQARVHMDIDSQYELPIDTSATINSKSLMGGVYLALQPGGDMDLIENGGAIEYTQAPQNLEQLLGKFIFSMQDGKDKDSDG